MRQQKVMYATHCNNFEYIAPHWQNTYIYYNVVNIQIMPMRCDVFKIIATSCVNNYFSPHIRLRFFNTMFNVIKVDFILKN